MDLTEVIRQAQGKGLISILPFGLRGRAKYVIAFIAIMAETRLDDISLESWGRLLWSRRN